MPLIGELTESWVSMRGSKRGGFGIFIFRGLFTPPGVALGQT
jgi:hypothetical protein